MEFITNALLLILIQKKRSGKKGFPIGIESRSKPVRVLGSGNW